MRSRIYEGRVHHRRERPVPHAFNYRLFMMYLDLAEVETLFRRRWLWSAGAPNLAWFRRRDHFGDPARPLLESVRSLVASRLGRVVTGPVCLLTHLRYFGCCMNPVSFYYCWQEDGVTLDAVVAEVHNTPWGETHCYVLDMSQGGRHGFSKSFHVSPFMGMNQRYQWRLSPPDETLSVSMRNIEDGERVFSAGLAMRARPVDRANLARVLVRYPTMTGKVIGTIYWQALKLWWKGAPFYAHPNRARLEAPHADSK